MIEPCKYCQSQAVAAVLDKQIEARPTAGNKYRKRCLGCQRWLPCCSTADFQAADRQHVLPRGVDRDSEQPTVPVEEYDGQVDGIQAGNSANSTNQRAMTDGGQPVVAEDTDDESGEEVNEFDCPACDEHVEGQPDDCPECGVPYQW
ncbi:putative protein 13 [Haloarcula hispanica icosahedral virus 2]|uniref:Uncharacterized protein n=1 Tax=Haloarcula hispanica icosahedral virus 2 TaxID=1154689 RepID=H9AZW9_9VIRU|nr:putative protein 13 [Haloarcula hispanica icosahedral virus 2]AFD02294.1 putative protein 13 [Haloarcula hispanica icosahedral virus 2]